MSIPLHAIDDDDENFDWEAAVREIDVACNHKATTIEKPTSISSNLNCNSRIDLDPYPDRNKKGKFNGDFTSFPSTKQSTLDRFIGPSSRRLEKPRDKVELYNTTTNNSSSNGDTNAGILESEDIQLLNGCLRIDPEAAKTWIYPVNVPRRDYQFSITRTALFSNTLVVLPTGLGKTLIAAVVMYNYFRWFPEGKIVFAAPSRPLVMQQIEACHNIVGIPQEWTIDLTGQTSPTKRAAFWKDKRVFFVTPQVLEKDIQSGSCLVKHLVCLVIDEAHRAMGNYSYCVAVRELMDTPVELRLLALSATPGSKQQTIQHVINNLQISTLEYRSESDPDVLPYVHERKIELVKVAMGDEAVKANDLLLDVIRPFVARLSALGVLQKRDIQTLSPCDFLQARDKFHQEPPPTIPHSNYGEIEGYFTVLITLYHVKKLLSSHGIRPAFEMLDEKLKQGSLARLLSRNEVLLKAKLLMQHTVSHGAPSPKLAKLLEVLVDHFKVKDPQNSRVIIFSNFRGSVRDIMDALSTIRELVKATEFIGQSSGKTLKGQTQKVQQAVLQKFRTGGYNVIVATSIGEEGLDIMEVDLVICFDANVSPLRMIQRMGRTGRKNEGRVVVLACEGSELKAYLRKKANSKSIMKHMHNNGMNSFDFHPSPRMVPHIFKPEVQFLEMSIEKFIPRGKKLSDDSPISVPLSKTKLTDKETKLVATYFASTVAWRASLIAFPHFQAFPSPMNKVAHSSRTGMLIDTMQYLQGLTVFEDSQTNLTKDDDILDPCLRVGMLEPCDNIIKDKFDDFGEENLKTEVLENDIEFEEISRTEDMHIEDLRIQKPCIHLQLFGSEFVSVDDIGNVLILSLPQLSLNSHSNCVNVDTLQAKGNPSSQSRFPEGESWLESRLGNLNAEKLDVLFLPEKIVQSPVLSKKSEEKEVSAEDQNGVYDTTLIQLDDESSDELRDSELSPRLTNFIESGVVPESPIKYGGTRNSGDSMVPALVSSPDMQKEFPMNSWKNDEKVKQDGSLSRIDVPCLSYDAVLHLNNTALRASMSPVPAAKEAQTPITKLSNTSSSSGWLLDSGVNPETVEQQCKFKRLRKLGDLNRNIPLEPTCSKRKLRTSPIAHNHTTNGKGEKKRAKDVAVFIEDEAEVSSEGMSSDDDDDEQIKSSYEDSFIDDGQNPTSASTQGVGASRPDMMAVYRRSLLSQSPFQRLPNSSENFSPDSVVQSSRLDGSGSSSGIKDNHTTQIGLESTARNSRLPLDRITSELAENENIQESRKRKLSYHQAQSVPIINLEEAEFSLLSEAAVENMSMQMHPEKMVENKDIFVDEDDLFYEGIDLDAIEEEAAKLIRMKSEGLSHKTAPSDDTNQPNFEILDPPSFNLGI